MIEIGDGLTLWRCKSFKNIHGRRVYLRGKVNRCLRRRLIADGFIEVTIGIWTWVKEYGVKSIVR